jgi:hypothetical protein
MRRGHDRQMRTAGHVPLGACRPAQFDPWWENETDWRRAWKNLFPKDCREIAHTAPHGLTAEQLKATIFAYPTGASDVGYML